MILKFKSLAMTIAAVMATMSASSQTDEWQNPAVNAVNREPMHTNFFGYESDDAALVGHKESSPNFMTLNGNWKFNWVRNSDMRPTDFFRTDFNDRAWVNMPVPGNWELNGYGDPLYLNIGYAWRNQFESNPPHLPVENNHVGSYRRQITIPSNWDGKQIVAHFGSVTSNMYLWVNGKYVGYSEDSKLEAEFDITKYLKKGTNLIAFQTFRWCDGTYLEDQDFMRLSGVGRDCYLYARGPKHIRDIRITPDLDAQYKDATLNIALETSGKSSVRLQLLDREKKLVAEKTIDNAGKQQITMSVENPLKWSAETPNLYTLLATLSDGGKEIESVAVKVGFRKIEMRDAQVLVNGQPVLFKGANRHEMDPDHGYVISSERMLQDIKTMKDNNINAVRTCHYPDNNLWYELCDEHGIYVVAEANVESHGMGYDERTLAGNALYEKAHMERNQRNVQRSFNHPSIIFWSLGNEAGFGKNFELCYNWVKNEDRSRPVQYERAGQNDFTDIYCPMYLDYNSVKKYCEADTKKPLILCEYAHAMGNSMGGFKEYWDLVRKYPKYQGGFIWDFVDQSIRRYDHNGTMYYGYGGDFNRYDASDNNFMDNGLISPDRKLNPHMDEVAHQYQSIWATATPADIMRGEIEVYNENFFRDLSNYYIEWQLMSDGKCIEIGTLDKLDIAPQQRATVKLGYSTTDASPESELMLNVRFKLKRAEQLIEATHTIAQNQLCIREHSKPDMQLAAGSEPSPMVTTNDVNYLIVKGENFTVEFGKTDGFLCRYDVRGVPMLKAAGKLTPNFWRSPTDNDFGANLQNKYKVWKNPNLKLTSQTHHIADGLITIKNEYDMPDVKAQLSMIYTINSEGAIKLTQKMTADKSAEIADMFRFGIQIQMPREVNRIKYYGRGPGENYADRKSAAFIGLYNQLVADQAYSYIRPQETGTKSDVRWWQQMTPGGKGLRIVSEEPFSASALNYSIESLDDGAAKDQNHTQTVPKSDYTNFCIDKAQMGLGCVDSWGQLPIDEYRLHYGDRQFTLIMQPIEHGF